MTLMFFETGARCLVMGVLGACASFVLAGIFFAFEQTVRCWKEMTK